MKRVLGVEIGASHLVVAIAEPDDPPRIVLGAENSFPAAPAGAPRWKWSIDTDPTAERAAHQQVAKLFSELHDHGAGSAELTVLALSAGYGDARAGALVGAFAAAGFPSIRVLDEEAALALGVGRSWLRAPGLVLDLGASHCGVAMVSLSETQAFCIAREGSDDLGLDNVALQLRDELTARIERALGSGIGTAGSAILLHELREALSSHRGGPLTVRSIAPGGAAPWDLVVPENALDWLREELADGVARLVDRVLARAKVPVDALARAWFTGGAAFSEAFRESIQRRIGVEMRPVSSNFIANGAARFGVELLGGSTPTPIPYSAPPVPASIRDLAQMVEVDRSSWRPTASAVPSESTWVGTEPSESVTPRSLHHSGPPPGAHKLATHGEFRGARTPVELLGMPLMRAATEQELVRPYLPVVILQLATAQAQGTLSLTRSSETARIVFSRGGVCVPPLDRARLQRVLEWPEGQFVWRDEAVSPAAAKHREATFGFVASGLRTALRGMSDQTVLSAFGPRLSLSPVVIPERRRRVNAMGLGPAEQRAVDHMLDGTKDVEGLLGEGYIGRLSFMRVLLLLEAFGALRWVPPAENHSETAVDRLTRRLANMEREDHFTALGLHWTATHDEVIEAWTRLQEECAPTGRWASIDRGLTAKILARGAVAWEKLRDDTRRVNYRHELHPDVDETMLATIVAAQAELLAFRGETKVANAMRGLALEMANSTPPTPTLKRG